jgi:hypothetical protein
MASINNLMLGANDDGSNEYKEGWNCAVGYLNDSYIIHKRNGEPISIVFDVVLDEDELIKKIKGGNSEHKQ